MLREVVRVTNSSTPARRILAIGGKASREAAASSVARIPPRPSAVFVPLPTKRLQYNPSLIARPYK
jgi:hypothetical protein